MSKPWTTPRKLGVLGTGSALPGPAISSAALVARAAERFGLANPRRALAITERMGIATRHLVRDFADAREVARPGDSNPELSARAVRSALDQAGLPIESIDYLIGHTTSPAQHLPANIALVADHLGYAGPHLELRQACTGFANALMIAHGLITINPGARVAIVGSETASTYLDPATLDSQSGQLVNFVQMGDGAGAVVVSAPGCGATIDATWYGAVGMGRAPGISLAVGADQFEHDFEAIRAEGHVLFDAGRASAADLGYDLADAHRVIPHQVSGRIGAQMARHFGLCPTRAFVNADRVGNTGSAAIWIALDALRGEARTGDMAIVLGAEASKFMFGGFAYTHG